MPTFNLLVSILGAILALGADAPAAQAQRGVLSEGFERALTGWRAEGARVERARRGAGGGHAARLVATGSSRAFSLRVAEPLLTRTTARAVYRARAWVRSDRPGRRVCLRLQELGPRTTIAGARRCVRARRTWRRLPQVTLRARGTGHRLSLGLHQDGGRRGESFEADRIRLTATPPTTTAAARRASRTLPPGATLPSGERCALGVARDGWEPRPQNRAANRTRGLPLVLPADRWSGFRTWRERARRVTGAFTGTTDEIIRWASCKWGFSVELTRAQAHVESGWDQGFVGDQGQSVGVLQVKAAGDDAPHDYTSPHSARSTAYNLDYALAWRRACYEGDFAEGGWLPPSSRGDLWDCVGLWYSGRWGEGYDDYLAAVRAALRERPWLRYTPPEG